MQTVSGADLAREFDVTRGRVSQWLNEGKLEGCFSGIGRARRFDIEKCRAALSRNLDVGQMMGNGATTRKQLGEHSLPMPDNGSSRKSDRLEPRDPDRYELARIQKAEEEVIRARRMNAEAEGRFVLASEVDLATRRIIAQEIAAFELMLRRAARRVADDMGVDFKEVRQLMVETWREYRAARADEVSDQAADVSLSDKERAEDI